jgi:hypothetical protein
MANFDRPLPDVVADPVVNCPACDGPWLHHLRVEVFDRRCEDAEDGLHVAVERTQLHVDTDLTDNPSGRRDGVRIFFYCEWCCAIPVLNIVQHKGNTLLSWQDRHGDTACGPECDRYPVVALATERS